MHIKPVPRQIGEVEVGFGMANNGGISIRSGVDETAF
jgi:hypothetical protein